MIGILSYPRSGNHFVRYIIEFLSGRATVGCTNSVVVSPFEDSPICCRQGPKLLNHVTLDNPIACKFHFANPPTTAKFFVPIGDVEKLILILRYPTEALISHNRNLKNKKEAGEVFGRQVEKFIENLNFYQNFVGPKETILYEDLLSESHSISVKKISSMIGAPQERSEEFIQKFNLYKQDSLKSLLRKPRSSTVKNMYNFYSEKMKSIDPEIYTFLMPILEKIEMHPLILENYSSERNK